MRIIHLSDLHFGTESGSIVQDIIESIKALAPNLIIISGDFTQIASKQEFEQAQNFISELPAQVFCIPGNHDIPRYNLFERLFNPYNKYKKFINKNLSPVFITNDFVLAGMNTARRVLAHWNWANGAISKKQLDMLEDAFAQVERKYRICVMHHPVHKPAKSPLKVFVFGASRALKKIKDLQVDIVLTGHVHYASLTVIHKTVFVSASTAISSRLRAQENGFNVIDLSSQFFEITHHSYNEKKFRSGKNITFQRNNF